MDGKGSEAPRAFKDHLGGGLMSSTRLNDGHGGSGNGTEKRGGDMVIRHEHVDCPPDQRKWLERRLNQAATLRPHSFCVTCGRVKNTFGPKARKLGFYLSGLSALKEYLERSAKYGKMTQSQSRLIAKALEGLDEFEDSYGLRLEVQKQLYLQAVKMIRPDLDDELVVRLLPKVRRRPKKPLIQMIAEASAV